ncbi:MAG: hypothetical protein IPH72_22760 [Sandaracinaceae bacterium]|nr:hypothetical protein [Sandaracinaceae bacterium]
MRIWSPDALAMGRPEDEVSMGATQHRATPPMRIHQRARGVLFDEVHGVCIPRLAVVVVAG